MFPTSDLAEVGMQATKDIPEKESETGGSGAIEITQDDGANETKPRKHGNILNLDRFLPNIEIGGGGSCKR